MDVAPIAPAAPPLTALRHKHLLGIRMFCGRLTQWLMAEKQPDSQTLDNFFDFMCKVKKPGVLGHLVRSPKQRERFLETQSRAALTVLLQPVSRMEGPGWNEALGHLGKFFCLSNVADSALFNDVSRNVVCSRPSDVVWSKGEESAGCLGTTWPLPAIAPMLERHTREGGQRVVKQHDG